MEGTSWRNKGEKEREKEYGKETLEKGRKKTHQGRIDKYLKKVEGSEEQTSEDKQQQKASSFKLGASGILRQRRQQFTSTNLPPR